MDWMLPGPPSQNIKCVQQQFNMGGRWYIIDWAGPGKLHEQVAQTPWTLPPCLWLHGEFLMTRLLKKSKHLVEEQTRAWFMDESACCHQTVDRCGL